MAPRVPRRLKSIVRKAEDKGWTYDTTGHGHPRLTPPAGQRDPRTGELQRPVTFALTPSDWRGDKNSIAVLRRAGVDI